MKTVEQLGLLMGAGYKVVTEVTIGKRRSKSAVVERPVEPAKPEKVIPVEFDTRWESWAQSVLVRLMTEPEGIEPPLLSTKVAACYI